MTLCNSVSPLLGRAPAPRRTRRRGPARRLRLEPLDDRALPSSVTLAPSEPAPPLVGERGTWPATAADVGATPVYQFRVAPHEGPFRVVRDFSPANSFAWTPMQEG